MSKKQQQEELRKQEDQALWHGLLWVGAAAVLEILMLLVDRFYINYTIAAESVAIASALYSVLGWMRPLSLAAVVIGAVWMLVSKKKQKPIRVPGLVLLGAAAALVCAHMSIRYNEAGVQMLLLLIPVWGGVALSFYLYQREFFLSAVMGVLAAMGLWFVQVNNGISLEVMVTCAAIGAMMGAVLWMKQKNDGAFISKDGNYTLVLVSGLTALGLQLLGGMAGAVIAYYLMFVVVALVFALLVYYTIKMM